MKPSGSPEDSLLPRLLRDVLPAVAPAVLDIVNSSFSSGVFPAAFKNAVVQPLLKIPGLDQSDCANYHPISKLPLISKVVEKLALTRLTSHLDDNGLLDPFQSGFRRNYSSESAHIRILSNILILTDSGSHVLLLLLDLTAAFNTVDHTILLHRLEFWVGVTGTALEWFKSYLNGRCFSVHVGDCSSPNVPLPWGVPQGSILGPLLFSIYILPLGKILASLGVNYHFYADDCQIYLQINQKHSFSIMSECLSQVRSWLSQNCLRLNDSKSDAILFSPTNMNGALDVSTLPLNLKSCATSLGVKLDSDLSMSSQVNATVKSCFFQLRRITRLKSILKLLDLESVIHVFITSCLDYANSVLIGINASALSKLQKVQNAAARFLTNTDRRMHITPILTDLHWLPVKFRINFKVLLYVYKALYCPSPSYLTDLLTPYVPTPCPSVSRSSASYCSEGSVQITGGACLLLCSPKTLELSAPPCASGSLC
uniref:Reverse transcriptase domain-containing protein n=1 Tax=Nothobranchius furzeri TaxID=105023 RepID=A0A8C6P6I6_NOTFU